jgi:Fe-S-cluster containining protein
MSESGKTGGREMLALEIETPEGPLRAMLGVPPRPMRLAELAFSFLGVSGKLTDLAVEREAREGREVSCRKGCGACCRQVVPLSPPEAWLIADIVAGMPPPRQAEVRAAFAAAVETLTRSGVKAAFSARMDRVEQMTAAALDYFHLGIACPFLRDESCSIHPYRPSICREYMVTSPAENCATLGLGPIRRIPVNVRMSEAFANLTARLLGKEPEVIPMTLALEWAAQNRADSLRTWDGRTLIEGLIAELAPRPAS